MKLRLDPKLSRIDGRSENKAVLISTNLVELRLRSNKDQDDIKEMKHSFFLTETSKETVDSAKKENAPCFTRGLVIYDP